MKKLLAPILLLVITASAGIATAGWTHKMSAYAPAVKVATPGVANVSIEAAPDFSLDTEQPPRISVIAPEGIVIEKIRRTPAADGKADETRTDIEIAFTATKKGRYALTATADFTVCSARYCEPATETLSFDIDAR
jgi:hypothetical protein